MSSQTTRTETAYRDRQYSRMLLGLGAFIAFGCGIAVGAVFGDGVRLIVWMVLGSALCVGVWRTRLDVAVDADGVHLGRAGLPWSAVRTVEVLDAVQLRAALTTDAHPHDYRRIRSTTAGIRVWLDDPTDPHRAWVASVKDPVAIAAVLRQHGVS